MDLDNMTRSKVLRLLSENNGYISGENMASRLGVSRAAVWKAVKSLVSEGYEIEAVTNRGYKLVSEPDTLSREDILAHINEADCNVIALYSVDSTNNEAKRLAADGAPSWTVVTAQTQTGGRGRYGRSFYSPAGCGAYFSLLLRDFHMADPTLMTTAAAVAVCRAIEALTGLKPLIKWVNDLYLNGKKVCGILSEALTSVESGAIDSIVVGIGVNFTQDEDMPEELRAIVGALFENLKPTITRSRFIAEIINQLYDIVSSQNSIEFMDAYRERSFIIGKQIAFTKAGKKISAEAVRIDDNGALIVKLPDGTMEALHSGEVSINQILI